MNTLRFCLLLSLVALCTAVPTERTITKKFFFVGCYRCPKNTVCAGPIWRKRCVIPMTLGKTCGVDPYWVCAKGLKCKKHVCTLPKIEVGGDCTREGSVCVSGAVCAGTDKKKMCVKPMGPGGRCGSDPFWVCKSGLECSMGACVKPKVPLGESCLERGSRCVEGAICVGTPTKKLCKRPRTVGQSCEVDPFWVCEDGLDCVSNICVKPKVPRGGDCLPEGSVCEDGTVCAGSDRKKKCVVPKGVGMQCGQDPFWVCESGLECSPMGECTKPKIGLGGDCKPRGSVCEDGLFCLGDNGLRKCVKGMTAGQKCGLDPFWSCQPGLTCVDRICKH
eukprot:gb/GEZJ01000193.1/.p1 GENE.gb/GEZJ01000193.1/~~gb/GEZJ01000193.1/.p1  ORF type:complete len:333 (-),score=13.08 gb/GEZJ01000193.1/:1788-2786(-)